MAILDERQIEEIRKHKYQAEGKSILEPFFIPIWEYIAAKTPRRISQHAVTLIGIVASILPCSVLLYFAYYGDTKNLEFTSYFCAIGFFIWLQADAVDGKLARLRNTSSQFGEILDHGCDAIALIFSAMTLACMLGVNSNPFIMLLWCISDVVVNYINEPYAIYFNGKMKFESVDIVEVLLTFSLVSLVTGYFGLDIWHHEIIQSIGFQARYVFFGVKILIPLDLIFSKLAVFYKAAKRKQMFLDWFLIFWMYELSMWSLTLLQRFFLIFKTSYRNKQWSVMIKTQMFLKDALLPSVSPLITIMSAAIAFRFASQEFLDRNIILFVLPIGFTIAKLHILLIVCHMSKSKCSAFDYCVLFPMAMALGMVYCTTSETEMLVLAVTLIITVLDTSIYLYRLFHQLYHAFDERLLILDDNQNAMSNGKLK